ncbi:facilitated trehalose transporter Tret1-like [Cotesia glomerata]|uniref:facilitated trehalose transporter Tret1-like n=1 Tax=Cotesia glomerata TaxID=32391 RepID=UPI001D024C8B|nr:facilitated trehalose transporter Tret1-like [Cotesia glomerata]
MEKLDNSMTYQSDLPESRKVSCISGNTAKNNEKGSKTLQLFAAMAANICVMASGISMGWQTPLLLMLQEDPVNEDNPIGRPITEEEASWIVSLPYIGTWVSCFVPGYLSDRFGRRTVLLASVVPSLLSWALVGLGTSIEVLYAARFISGLSISISFALLPIYCGEIAEPEIRGILGSFFEIFINAGPVFAFSIGPYVSYTNYCIACAASPALFFILFFGMPESPYYFAAKGRKEELIKVLERLRGKSREAVEKEADEIEIAVQESFRNKATVMDLFRNKVNFKVLVLTSILFIFQQLSGITVVLFYSEIIFASAGEFSLSTSVQTILVGVFQFLGTCFNPLVIDRLGRRILLIVSSAGSAICLGLLGLFFYLKDAAKSDVSNLGWLPIFSMLAFMVSYSIGLGPVSWTIIGEIYSQEIKAKASTIFVFICCALLFTTSKYFTNVASAFGLYTAFWIFAVCSLLCILFIIFFLPETKGKSLQQIQDELSGKKR